MPCTEAQKRASKNWRENNKEKANECYRKYREANAENYKKYSRTAASVYYYKHREEILEKRRMKYLDNTLDKIVDETLADLYHSNCKEDDQLTDSISLDSSDSTISNLTDWSTVVTEMPQLEVKEEPKPEPLGKTIFAHPLFKL
jgi:hypothetical protein